MAEKKEIVSVLVSYEDFTSYDHIPIGNFYFKTAMGDIIYLKTSQRELAQAWIDDYAGVKNKYVAIPSKVFKTKSRQENGLSTATGTASRRK
jgi:hypothetical protein